MSDAEMGVDFTPNDPQAEGNDEIIGTITFLREGIEEVIERQFNHSPRVVNDYEVIINAAHQLEMNESIWIVDIPYTVYAALVSLMCGAVANIEVQISIDGYAPLTPELMPKGVYIGADYYARYSGTFRLI